MDRNRNNDFRDGQLAILIGVNEVGQTERNTPENKIAMEALIEALRQLVALGKMLRRPRCLLY